MMTLDIEIADLFDRPVQVKELVEWYRRAWAPWYGDDGDGDAEADIAACLRHKNALPVCLIALDPPTDAIIGACALRDTSVGAAPDQTPWLAALLPLEPAAGERAVLHGALIAAAGYRALEMGYRELYCSSSGNELDLLTGLGWEPVGEATSLRGPLQVVRKSLA